MLTRLSKAGAVAGASPKPNKYRNERTEYGGVVYASRSEAKYAYKLDAQLRARQIREWRRGTPIVLVAGIREERVTYTPDFEVAELDGSRVLIDVKGARTETAAFQIKVRLLRRFHPELRLIVSIDGAERQVAGPGYLEAARRRNAALRQARAR